MLLARAHEIKAGVNMKYTNTHKCQKSKPHSYQRTNYSRIDNAPFYLSNKPMLLDTMCLYIILMKMIPIKSET